jgi:hypothetical protein
MTTNSSTYHPKSSGQLSYAVSSARSTVIWPMVVAAAMMLLGVALRIPTADYTGPRKQGAFNAYIFQFLGGYSDITSLYIRDQLWRQPVPYFEYPLEYPVGIGLLTWLINSLTNGLMPYFLATAAVLVGSGLLMIWLAHYFDSANLWLLALWPTLPLYVVMNWDMLALLPTVAALVLFRYNRDGWGGLLLAIAIWTKFFPIILVPLVVFERVLRRRWQDAATIVGVISVASVIINAPFAIQITPDGVKLREGWLHFFRFNQERPPQHWSANFWEIFERFGIRPSTEQINTYSALLLILGLGVVMLLMYNTWRRGLKQTQDLLLPASLAFIGWFFFINKVYSCQYSFWIAVLLALLAARSAVAVGLAVIFGAADFIYCMSIFIEFYLGWSDKNPAAAWAYAQLVWPTTVLREGVILAIIAWAAWQIARPPVVCFRDEYHLQSGG